MTEDFQLDVFDVDALQNVTDRVDNFEWVDTFQHYGFLQIDSERKGVCLARDNPKNQTYFVTITDKSENTKKMKLEVCDDIQNGIPVLLDFIPN